MNIDSESAKKSAYRIEDLALQGPIRRTAIFFAIKSGQLPARKHGRNTIILAQDWENFLQNLPLACVKGKAA